MQVNPSYLENPASQCKSGQLLPIANTSQHRRIPQTEGQSRGWPIPTYPCTIRMWIPRTKCSPLSGLRVSTLWSHLASSVGQALKGNTPPDRARIASARNLKPQQENQAPRDRQKCIKLEAGGLGSHGGEGAFHSLIARRCWESPEVPRH